MIVRPKRILWTTDFSSLSLKAAEYARGFQETFGAELHVVHVCQPQIGLAAGLDIPYAMDTGIQKELLEAAEARLETVVKENFPADSSAKREVLMGIPWYEICSYARRAGVDLIIIATHGRTGLKHVLVGSVAERVVQHAACPVLVVKSVERDFTA